MEDRTVRLVPAEKQEQENMIMEQMRHIHQLIMRADGAENIQKLTDAEHTLAEIIVGQHMMDRMGGG